MTILQLIGVLLLGIPLAVTLVASVSTVFYIAVGDSRIGMVVIGLLSALLGIFLLRDIK